MEATIIPLTSWQDPQGDLVLVYSEQECSVFFGCWTASSEPADYICRLSFEQAIAVRSFTREFLPYQVADHNAHSYILKVQGSDWPREQAEYRRQYYPSDSGQALAHCHFVVVGHDICHEVLAVGFSETTIPVCDLSEKRLLALHRGT